MQTYKVKSSAARTAKKDHGANWKQLGEIKPNADGEFYFELTPVAPVKKGALWTEKMIALGEEEVAKTEHKVSAIDAPIRPEPIKTTKCIIAERNLTVEGALKDGAPVEKKVVDFMLKKSEIEKPCNQVWEIAIEMNAVVHQGEPAPKRKDVIAACVEQGVAYNTARTQYQAWFKASKA